MGVGGLDWNQKNFCHSRRSFYPLAGLFDLDGSLLAVYHYVLFFNLSSLAFLSVWIDGGLLLDITLLICFILGGFGFPCLVLSVLFFWLFLLLVHVTGAVGLGRTGRVWRLYSFFLGLPEKKRGYHYGSWFSPLPCIYWRLSLAVHRCGF